jgi:hypothetical protein
MSDFGFKTYLLDKPKSTRELIKHVVPGDCLTKAIADALDINAAELMKLADQNHLSLYHYNIFCLRDEKNAGGLNNFGVASQKSNLAVLAAKRYKRAFELGETYGASNLAKKVFGSWRG